MKLAKCDTLHVPLKCDPRACESIINKNLINTVQISNYNIKNFKTCGEVVLENLDSQIKTIITKLDLTTC